MRSNPLNMKYSLDEKGNFDGQTEYGYISFGKFVVSVMAFKEGKVHWTTWTEGATHPEEYYCDDGDLGGWGEKSG